MKAESKEGRNVLGLRGTKGKGECVSVQCVVQVYYFNLCRKVRGPIPTINSHRIKVHMCLFLACKLN